MAVWSASTTKAGKYKFDTAGKFVDRDIELTVTTATATASGTANSTDATANVTISDSSVGTKASGAYPITGSADISGTVSGTATGALSGQASGADGGWVTSVTSGNVTGSVSGTASVSGSISAAAATVTASKAATKPTSAKDTTNTNVEFASTAAATTTKPSSGSYIAVKATAPATTITPTVTVNTKGYLGDKSEITASAGTTATTGDTYYYPIKVQTTGTSNTGTNVSTITPGTSAKYINVTTGYQSEAKKWTISAVSKDTAKTVLGNATYEGGTSTVATDKSVTRGTYKVKTDGYSGAADTELLAAASFANAATSGKTYVDISDTAAAPILISGDYLYINKGYTDDLKISLAKLVPDPSDPTKIGASGDLLSGKILYDNDGNPVTGTIETKTSSDLSASGATVTVPAGYYATQATKSVASGSVNSYAINETSQADIIVSAGTKSGNYYPISVPSLTGTVNRTAGYISGTTSTAADSNGGVVGKIAASTTSGSDKTVTATASASAYDSTSNLASGTYATSATTGYTYHIDSSASSSVDTQTATKTVGVGYVGSAVTATAKVNGASNSASAKTYLKDSTSSIASGGTIPQGTTLTIGKGYYPSDRTFTAQAFSATENITGSLSTTIDSGYTAPTLVDSKVSGKAYVTITGNGSMTAGNIYSGTATAKIQYMEVYKGTYSVV